jgi:hypothetical protein
MKQEVKIGQTDYTVLILIRDSTTGAPKTGLTFESAGIDVCYVRVETDNDVTVTAGAPVALATPALTDPHLDWGFLEVDATNAPGLYRLDLADGVFATGAWSAVVSLICTGCDPVHLEFVLVPEAPYTGVIVPDWINGGRLDLILDAILEDTADVQPKLGTITNMGSGATVGDNLKDIEAQTDDIGAAGAGLTALPWNAAWDTEVQSECTDALNAYDPPTKAELDTAQGAVTLANGAHGGAAATLTLLGAAGIVATKLDAPINGAITGNITGNLSGSVGSVTGAVGSVTGNVGGNVSGSVASVAANGITATSIASDAINAASVKADAVTKIQNGLATPTNITAASGVALTVDYDAAKTAAQAGDAMTIDVGGIQATSFAAGAIDAASAGADLGPELATALLDLAAGVETNRTLRQAMRLILAALVGKLSGAETTSVVIRDTNDVKDRITATVDSDGNRSAIIYDAS